MISGLIILDQRSNQVIQKEQGKFMKDLYKTYLQVQIKDTGKDIFIFGLIMQYSKKQQL